VAAVRVIDVVTWLGLGFGVVYFSVHFVIWALQGFRIVGI